MVDRVPVALFEVAANAHNRRAAVIELGILRAARPPLRWIVLLCGFLNGTDTRIDQNVLQDGIIGRCPLVGFVGLVMR